MAQTVMNSPTMQETWVRPLGWEDSLEEGMATHSSILSWRIPWTEEPGRLQSMGHQELDTTKRLSTAHQSPKKDVEASQMVTKQRFSLCVWKSALQVLSLVVQGLRLHAPNGWGSIPTQGARSHIPKLRLCMLQLKKKKKKILHAVSKIKIP